MKKNISINISGIIFHIEEDGYETLRKYLDSVNRYFGSFEDSSEILADIEGRIAEIFLSRLNEGKQVITAEDVNTLIATMGSVNDFKAAEEQEAGSNQQNFSSSSSTSSGSSSAANAQSAPRRLVRDKSRKILGGVCAGLGNYFNIDPVWPRLIMALLALGTSGIFIVVYVVLWIVLPEEDLEDQPSVKKMYRDPDKKVLGGVAAGVAAFFNGDIALVRFLFVIATIFGGVGILLYIILWIALPEAKTITEKMEMQGEPVTLSNIESSVKKGKMESSSQDESTLTKIILFPFRALGTILRALSPLLVMFVEILRVGIGLVVTFTGLTMIFAILFAFGILMGLFHAPDWHFFSDFYIGAPGFPLNTLRNSFPGWMVFFTFLVTLIPAMFVLLLGSSIIAKKIIFNATAGWTLFVIFFISVAVVSFSVPQVILGFKEEGEYKIEKLLTVGTHIPVLKIHETGLDDYNVTTLYLRGYDGKDIKIVERFQSQGPTRKLAAENAKMVTYEVEQSDSVITFDSNITFSEDAKFRAQRLDVDVYVPFERPFVVDASLWRLIDTNIIYRRLNDDFSLNEDTQTWKMTSRGLECVSCKPEDLSLTGAQDQYGLRDFNAIDLKGIFDLRIERGDEFAVEIKGPAEEKKRYEVYVSGETLVIDYNDRRKNFWKRDFLVDKDVKIFVTMPSLRELDLTGAGKLRFRGFNENEVDIKVMGAIDGEGELDATSLNVKLTGASMLDLSGKGKFLEAEILGASGLRAYGYEVEHCIVEAHGASSAKVNVTDKLEITKGIASSVTHHGDPEVIKR